MEDHRNSGGVSTSSLVSVTLDTILDFGQKGVRTPALVSVTLYKPLGSGHRGQNTSFGVRYPVCRPLFAGIPGQDWKGDSKGLDGSCNGDHLRQWSQLVLAVET